MPKFGEVILGGTGKVKSATKQTEEQQMLMKLITDALSKGEGPLKELFGGFDEGAFQKGVTDPALKNFQERILPMITEKYIGGNQAHGSALMRSQQRGATDVQSKLAELMYQAQNDQKKNQIAGVQTALGTQTKDNFFAEKPDGLLPAAIEGGAKAYQAHKAG